MSELDPALLLELEEIGASVRRRRIGLGVLLMVAGAVTILVGFIRAVEGGGLDAISWILGASLVSGMLLPHGARVVDQVTAPRPRTNSPDADAG